MPFGGPRLVSRFIVLTAAALACAGCAESGSGSLQRPSAASLQPPPALAHTPAVGSLEDETERLRTARKTLASKVLAAIALERVTGRKPDPGRLAEAN